MEGGSKVPMLVTSSLPSEIVLCLLLGVMVNVGCLSGDRVFKAPFSCDGFDNEVLFKFLGDAGVGSFKSILNLVNVLNRQGLEHIMIFLEFSDLKDTYKKRHCRCI